MTSSATYQIDSERSPFNEGRDPIGLAAPFVDAGPLAHPRVAEVPSLGAAGRYEEGEAVEIGDVYGLPVALACPS